MGGGMKQGIFLVWEATKSVIRTIQGSVRKCELRSQILALTFFFFLNDPTPPEFSPLPHPAPFPTPPAEKSAPGTNTGIRSLPPLVSCLTSIFPAFSRVGIVRKHRLANVPPCPHRFAGTASSGFGDRKSTRLNSSHSQISYAVFCLKK